MEAQDSVFKRAMKLLRLKPCVLPAHYGAVLYSLAESGDELGAKQAEMVASGEVSRWTEEGRAIVARMKGTAMVLARKLMSTNKGGRVRKVSISGVSTPICELR
jgi:predicted regulator of Ras-like GTPase activity (Roadblock/LC7/MglB family)